MIRIGAQEEDCIQLGALIRRFAKSHIIRPYRHAPQRRALQQRAEDWNIDRDRRRWAQCSVMMAALEPTLAASSRALSLRTSPATREKAQPELPFQPQGVGEGYYLRQGHEAMLSVR